MQQYQEVIKKLEAYLGIPKGFFGKLLSKKEDDWTFIIKIHSLLETAVSFHLASELNNDDLLKIFSEAEMKQKVDFVKALKTFDKDCRRYLRKLSELRNKMVHNIQMANFVLKDYVGGLEQKDLEDFVQAFSFGLEPPLISVGNKGDLKSRGDLIRSNPRLLIWFGAMHFLVEVYSHKESIEWKRKYGKFLKEIETQLVRRETRKGLVEILKEK